MLWLALLAWRLQCFRVFRFSRSFFSFSWHELPASTKLCIVLTDAEISPTEHTTSQVATCTLATRRGAYLRSHRLNPRGNNLI